MPRPLSIADSLAKLLDGSDRPIYVVDAQRRIVYCNRALAHWINLERKQIVDRRVEFHSEEPAADNASKELGPLTDLCPPPSALAGQRSKGTISCMARDGRLIHRTAEFVPLTSVGKTSEDAAADKLLIASVLVLLATDDLSPQDLAKEISGDIEADELHRTIRQFRRAQAQRYSIHSLLGNSPAVQKVRAQVDAATASGSNALILGHPGSGRKHVALTIHYQSLGDAEGILLPINCGLLTEDLFGHAVERLATARTTPRATKTLLLENLERMSPQFQKLLLDAIGRKQIAVRIIATMDPANVPTGDDERRNSDDESQDASYPIDPALLDAISTITIRISNLSDRLEDLGILAQFFLERCNRNNSKQVGSILPDALDALALYSWPGELEQLNDVIAAAHAQTRSHSITAADLPPLVHQASHAASYRRTPPTPIVLDDLLASIEKEAITRALALARGNKSEAATLLGMTRPRFYRRLVQLGFVTDEPEFRPEPDLPEFIEHDDSK